MSSGPRPTSAWRWHLVFWCTLALTAGLVATGLDRVARAYHTDHVGWAGERYDVIDRGLNRLQDHPPGLPPLSFVFFGDSTVSQTDHGPSLPILTAQTLNLLKAQRWTKVASAAAPGAGITHHAFMADRVADAEPDLVIWQLSFFHFTDRWTAANGVPELAGFVDADRLPEIFAMSIENFGLSLSDILLQQAIVRLDLHKTHMRIRKSQLRVAYLIPHLEEVLNPNRGRRPESRAQSSRSYGYIRRHYESGNKFRYSLYGERRHFGKVLNGLSADEPKLHLLRSGIEALTEEGIDVLVYLNPMNLDRLRDLGLEYEEAVAQSKREIEHVVKTSGAHYLDLSALLEDADFGDAPGHFVEDEQQTIQRWLTMEIAKAARPILEAREQNDAREEAR